MRTRRRSRLVVTAVVGVLPLMLAAACSSSSSSPAAKSSGVEKPDITVGFVPAEASSALYIALQAGIFTKHGLHVKLEKIVSTEDVVPDLLHGSMDVAAGQVTTFIAAQAKGLGPFRIVASGVDLGPGVDELVALKSSGITSAKDLKGKSIGENAAVGNGVLLTDAALAIDSIKPTQVTYKVVPFPDLSAALEAHQIDAAYCTEPYCTELAQKDGAEVVADLDQGSAQDMIIGGYTVTASWLKKYPNTAAAFAASIDEASQLADTNLTDLHHALTASLGVNSTVADVMATGTFPSTVDPVKLEQVADLMTRFGELKAGFNASALAANP
jgi:NitT/TauT family transport system substrate-binding protein